MAAMREMVELDLAERSSVMGERMKEALLAMRHPAVEDVRGRGLLVGLEFREGTDTKRLSQAFLDEGILTKETRSRTFRFAPPLTITDTELDEGIAAIARAMESVRLVA
jgi:acetylornithine/succinyldiaminopimelate/putrescine aminotransferase